MPDRSERGDDAPGLHHLDIWVADIDDARASWGWLLESLGYTRTADWREGSTWAAGGSYLSITESPNLVAGEHDRRRQGINHLAFRGGPCAHVDSVMATAPAHGWSALYADRYPHAGGLDSYAGWLENAAGFKVEIVATVRDR